MSFAIRKLSLVWLVLVLGQCSASRCCDAIVDGEAAGKVELDDPWFAHPLLVRYPYTKYDFTLEKVHAALRNCGIKIASDHEYVSGVESARSASAISHAACSHADYCHAIEALINCTMARRVVLFGYQLAETTDKLRRTARLAEKADGALAVEPATGTEMLAKIPALLDQLTPADSDHFKAAFKVEFDATGRLNFGLLTRTLALNTRKAWQVEREMLIRGEKITCANSYASLAYYSKDGIELQEKELHDLLSGREIFQFRPVQYDQFRRFGKGGPILERFKLTPADRPVIDTTETPYPSVRPGSGGLSGTILSGSMFESAALATPPGSGYIAPGSGAEARASADER